MSAHTARDTLVLVLAHDRAKFGVLNGAFHGETRENRAGTTGRVDTTTQRGEVKFVWAWIF